MVGTDADPKSQFPIVPPTRDGVVVNLSLPALTAAAARQIALSAAGAGDYTHLDPQNFMDRRTGDAPVGLAERIRDAAASPVPQSAPTADRAAVQTALPATSPDVRPDLYAHGLALAASQTANVNSAAPKLAASAVAQARDTERLAGLAVQLETRAETRTRHFASLLIAAMIVGALILILL